MSPHRSSDVERWKASLLTIADEPFFDLVRNYLGPVSSPFHKPQLVDQLAAFLRRTDVQRAIVDSLSPSDREILAAIDLCAGGAGIEALLELPVLNAATVELHHRLVNLEDRLLVYRESQSGTLFLNPVIAPVLREAGIGLSDLIHLEVLKATPEEHAAPPPVDETIFLGVLCMVCESPDLRKADGDLKKRALADVRKRAAGAISRPYGELLVTSIIDAVDQLGLVSRAEDGAGEFNRRAADRLSGLPTGIRRSLIWATTALCGAGVDIDYDAPDLGALAGAAAALVGSLATDRFTTPEGFASLISLMAPTGFDRELVTGLVLLGVLWSPNGELFAVHPSAAATIRTDGAAVGGVPEGEPAHRGAAVVLEPTFEITIAPHAPMDRLIPLAPLFTLRTCDRVCRCELTREGVARAVRAGIAAGDIAPALEELTGRPLPQNVAFSLQRWTADQEAVSLTDCVLLTVSEDRRTMVEHARELAPFILAKPAPGVFALDRSRETEWRAALRRLGIGVLPRVTGRDVPKERGGKRVGGNSGRPAARVEVTSFPATMDLSRHAHWAERLQTVARPYTPVSVGREQELLSGLDDADMTDAAKEELALRIRRKLILLPEQIRAGAVRPERREAKGLDYVGKVRIIESALRTRDEQLEVIQRGRDGRPVRHLLTPFSLDRRGGELVLTGETVSDREIVRIEVGKIALVRALRGWLSPRR